MALETRTFSSPYERTSLHAPFATLAEPLALGTHSHGRAAREPDANRRRRTPSPGRLPDALPGTFSRREPVFRLVEVENGTKSRGTCGRRVRHCPALLPKGSLVRVSGLGGRGVIGWGASGLAISRLACRLGPARAGITAGRVIAGAANRAKMADFHGAAG